jgi:hypothetical protein
VLSDLLSGRIDLWEVIQSRWSVFVKAVHDWLPAKYWSPQRASQNPDDVSVPTPFKQNSHRHMFTSTARGTVDPLLKQEITGHLWTTEGDAFFPAARPRYQWNTHVPVPPYPGGGATVVTRTVKSVSPSAIHLVWRSGCNRPLDHIDSEIEREPDLFPYPRAHAAGDSLTAPENEAWRWAALVGELKLRQGATESRSGFVLQLASYAREVFATQPGRGFVHSFIIVNHTMRCWVCGWSPLSSRC